MEIHAKSADHAIRPSERRNDICFGYPCIVRLNRLNRPEEPEQQIQHVTVFQQHPAFDGISEPGGTIRRRFGIHRFHQMNRPNLLDGLSQILRGEGEAEAVADEHRRMSSDIFGFA